MAISLDDLYKQSNPFIVLEDGSHTVGELISGLDINLKTYKERSEVVRTIRGSRSRSKKDFANEVSAALQFPLDFNGRSWDVFNEYINDLEWLPPTKSYILLVTDADKLLSDEHPVDLEILVRVLQGAAKSWESGANHDVLVNAYQAEVVPKTSKFTVVFQIGPNASDTTNFMQWLRSRPDIARVRI